MANDKIEEFLRTVEKMFVTKLGPALGSFLLCLVICLETLRRSVRCLLLLATQLLVIPLLVIEHNCRILTGLTMAMQIMLLMSILVKWSGEVELLRDQQQETKVVAASLDSALRYRACNMI